MAAGSFNSYGEVDTIGHWYCSRLWHGMKQAENEENAGFPSGIALTLFDLLDVG
jgi:hypothetical protein